jgi:crossover junction endonuclease EME1
MQDARAQAQSQRAAAREAKRQEKAAKALEKAEQQQIVAANRLKGRKEACPELIAYLPTTLPDKLHDNILNFLEPLSVDTREWTPTASDVIKFVRKVNADWDEEGGYFRPCDEEYRRDEEWIIHWLHAEEFVQKACYDPTGRALKVHLERVKDVLPGKKVVIMLQGLAALVNKAKLLEDRQHKADVRNHLGGSSQGRHAREYSLADLKVEELEMALIEMQLRHEIRIVQTTDDADSAEWISILATDIASIPYKYLL